MLPDSQGRDNVGKRRTKIRVPTTAVPRPPARVDRQLHQIRETADLIGAGRLTARQRPERVQIDRLGAFRHQVRVDELRVADLVVGVIADVLRHVAVEDGERRRVTRRRRVDAAQFVVLLPQISLDELGGGKEP
jgi:hypothetical protein